MNKDFNLQKQNSINKYQIQTGEDKVGFDKLWDHDMK